MYLEEIFVDWPLNITITWIIQLRIAYLWDARFELSSVVFFAYAVYTGKH